MADTSQVGSWQYVSGVFETAAATTGVKVRCVKDGSDCTTACFDGTEIREESVGLRTPQNGMIRAVEDQVKRSYSETYQYDAANRLIQVASGGVTTTYACGPNGERVSNGRRETGNGRGRSDVWMT